VISSDRSIHGNRNDVINRIMKLKIRRIDLEVTFVCSLHRRSQGAAWGACAPQLPMCNLVLSTLVHSLTKHLTPRSHQNATVLMSKIKNFFTARGLTPSPDPTPSAPSATQYSRLGAPPHKILAMHMAVQDENHGVVVP
jgi:hypothetical protein